MSVACRWWYRSARGPGPVFFLVGLDKVTTGGAFTIEGFAGYLDSLNVPLPELMAWVIAILELVGGAAIILGVAVSCFATLLAINMLVALLLTWSSFTEQRSEILLLMMALSLSMSGSGMLSIKQMMSKDSSSN